MSLFYPDNNKSQPDFLVCRDQDGTLYGRPASTRAAMLMASQQGQSLEPTDRIRVEWILNSPYTGLDRGECEP